MKYTDRESFSEVNTIDLEEDGSRKAIGRDAVRFHAVSISTAFKILPETLNQDVWHRWLDRRD